MYSNLGNFNDEMLNQSTALNDVSNTYKAFVEAIIPRTPRLAVIYGRIQYYGALDLYTDEYVIMSLNSLLIPLAIPVAEIINVAAAQLVYSTGENRLQNYSRASTWELFFELLPIERLQAISLLLLLNVSLIEIPLPFQNNQGNILSITMLLIRLTMMGYYSEWSGYGTTRLETPNVRKLEYHPISWGQIGYPGPSLGYRALRTYSFT